MFRNNKGYLRHSYTINCNIFIFIGNSTNSSNNTCNQVHQYNRRSIFVYLRILHNTIISEFTTIISHFQNTSSTDCINTSHTSELHAGSSSTDNVSQITSSETSERVAEVSSSVQGSLDDRLHSASYQKSKYSVCSIWEFHHSDSSFLNIELLR